MRVRHRIAGLKNHIVILLALFSSFGIPVHAGGGSSDHVACELGTGVLEVANAISDPTRDGAMDAITTLGTDSRYYLMVRGWLVQQIAADRSILSTGSGASRDDLKNRVAELQRAIRLIDLE